MGLSSGVLPHMWPAERRRTALSAAIGDRYQYMSLLAPTEALHPPRWAPAPHRLPVAHPVASWPSCVGIGGLVSIPAPVSCIVWSTCSIYRLPASPALQHPGTTFLRDVAREI